MTLTDGIDVTPQSTLSTIQFQSEVLNTVVTSLLTTLVIANLVSVINRLIFLSRQDHFSYRAFARSYVFLNSDDPLLLLHWLRGRYHFRQTNHSPAHHRIRKRRLIAPLFARLCMLVVSISSIALALPSEKRLDACSRGDHTVVLMPPANRPVLTAQQMFQVCSQIPLETRLGTVRSTASYCSFAVTPGDISALQNLASLGQNFPGFGFIGAGYSNATGMLISMIYSGDRMEAIASFVQWDTENGDRYHSLLPSWNARQHLEVLARGVSSSSGQECSILLSVDHNTEDMSLSVAQLSCTFDASDAIRYASASLRESLSFQKDDTLALRARSIEGSDFRMERRCAVDVTVTRPLINIVPLLIGLTMAFFLNIVVMLLVSRYGNAMDSAFHLVREVLGHDTSANPLQISTSGEDVERVALRKFVCADGISGHMGFVHGAGDRVVERFEDRIRVGRCMQVSCRGPRFVCELCEKGSGERLEYNPL
eukprot:TRINITY_DN35_c0_g1_i2.p1 TRINITY_DN35_c0_g1~~TRINITY_DN35_c0_g1_i2.p1  ORF type:complete len:482 (+),score=60.99 TRINITY_DN35_c0_g1_i2:311-1756(+)